MKSIFSLFVLLLFSVAQAQSVQSPSKQITLTFDFAEKGKPTYALTYKNKAIILQSYLGITLKNGADLASHFKLEESKTTTFNETWQPVLGEQSNIVNHYNELTIALIQMGTNRRMNIVFRVFDEGIAFRYDFPLQKDLNYFTIAEEVTEFNLTDNHKVFWLPGDFDSNEYVYQESLFSEIDTKKVDLNNGIGMKSIAGQFIVQAPLMMKSKDHTYLNIFEAAVVNYPLMHLDVDVKKLSLKSHLVPNAIGDKANLRTPCASPWRTIMVSDDARDVVGSKMILNLNEP
jgi:hypothetical protein